MDDLVKIAIIDSFVWLVWTFFIGFICSKLPKQFLDRNIVIPTSKKTASRIERYTKIRKWKDVVPEAGAFFKNGVSKKKLTGMSKEELVNFKRETKRAELAHYLFAAILPVFFLFNPFLMSIAMGVYALFANLPFILIQRFNRCRIDAILAKR